MKILYIVEAGGGVARHLLDLMDGVMKRGHEVTLAYSKSRLDLDFIKRINDLQSKGLNCIEINVKTGPAPSDIYAFIKLVSVAGLYGPFDIIHGHSSKGGALARLVAPVVGSKSIYTPHAFFTMSPGMGLLKRFIYGKIELLLSVLGNAVILTSRQELDHAHFLGLPSTSTHLVYNGSDPAVISQKEIESFRCACKINQGEFVFGFVGRFEYQKAPELLIEAFSHLPIKTKNLKLVMVGDGALRVKLRDLVKNLGISEFVVFPGFYCSKIAMRLFNVFVLPSRYEGSAYVFHDAALASLQIISTKVGGSDILVHQNINGYLVNQENIDDLVDAMRKCIEVPSTCIKKGENSLKIMANYSVDRMVSGTVDVYKFVVG